MKKTRPKFPEELSEEWHLLWRAAWQARSYAYAPYSKFSVGAALECVDGTIVMGCNVENISYGLTLCAERVAVGAAVAAGFQKFLRMVVASDSSEPVVPCGACRQTLAEFSSDLSLLSINLRGNFRESRLSDLLPDAKTGILG